MNKAFLPLLFWLSSTLHAATAPVQSDETLYFPCRSCHGDAGEGSAAIHAPALAGQDDAYLARQLRHFRDGQRGAVSEDKYGRQMALMAAYLTDSQIARLATYMARLPARDVSAAGMPGADNAADLYASCAACHGKNGAGTSALAAPRIGGLNSLYIATQLRHFRDGVRAYAAEDTPGQQMRAAMGALRSDTDIDSVAGYISQLSGAEREAP